MPGYLNITLASNQNNSGSTTANQGSVEPEGLTNLFPNQDVDGSGLVETNSTTQFVSDKNVVSAAKIYPTQIDKLVYDSSTDQLSQEIKDFLGKPVVVMSGTLTSTDTYSTFGPISVPFGSFTGNTMLLNKVSGYLGFRATVTFRLVVNANRFQQGRYIMSYTHSGGADANEIRTISWFNAHSATLVQRTTLPHVELDLCCDTEATISIPFNSAVNFYPFSSLTSLSEFGHWGYLDFFPYVPLSAPSGNLSAGFTIYSTFENVQLISAVIPQSGRVFSSKRSKKSDTEVEQDSSNLGPISSSLIKVRNVSDILGQIPLLSSYAAATSWFADIGASAAKVFGWSKPVSLQPSHRMTQNYLPYAANTDGPDMSFPLSYSYQNSVGVANGFSGTDVDEMSFAYLCTIPVWFGTLTWTVGQVPNTELKGDFVSPSYDVFTTVVNGGTFKHYSPLQFVASNFAYWRGSIVYRIKIVKTEFHSGRLMFVFNPLNGAIGTVPTPTLTTSAYIHRQIIDIREANEFTFVIPYVADSPYRRTGTANQEGYFGSVHIVVVEPLVAPATVSQSVSIILEKASGPDIEFAVPTQNVDNVFFGLTPQSGEAFSSVQQGSTICSNLDTTVGSSIVKSDNSLNALHCIGEKVISFRTLLKLPQQLVPSGAVTVANYFNILPFAITSGTVVTTVNTAPTVLNDLYSKIASCYVYSRGGVRLKYLDNSAVTTPSALAVFIDTRPANAALRAAGFQWSALNAAGTNAGTDRNNMPCVYYRSGYSGEVQVPQYHRFHSRVNSDCVANAVNPYPDLPAQLSPRIAVTRASIPNANVDTAVLRSISDDGNFGGFLSIPPMLSVVN